ncbi:winged helix-turn-helix transcriptional regulator [Candidatus Uhrbacteria bacterium]|nr:winged helix-turn-helix transcriptional regulator [Candidatus Uhrbacteria bacterium]
MLTKKQIKELKDHVHRKEERNEALARMFDALSDPTRFRMFQLFLECEELCVTDVAEILDISVPAASQQLKILDFAGLLLKERMGQMVCYRARKESAPVVSLINFLKDKKFSFKNLLSFYSN